MLLQNNYINYGVANGLKQKKVNKHAKQLYIENKREERDGVLIGGHIQNIPYLSIVTTQ